MYKCQLQELCQKKCWEMPVYSTVKDGLDHTPLFTGAVTVNHQHFETPRGHCRSSKEAQNLAAQIAFNHFTSQPSPLPPPVSGITPTDEGISHPLEETKEKSSREIPVASESAKRPKDLLHVYKNRLQQYAQKHILSLPTYSYEFDGLPHARRFKAKVTVGDKTYETLQFFPTLKEAEHAAAKVAFESLSHNDTEEDEALFKTMLQQLAQKEGLLFPSYITNKSGPPHTPIFMSTVEVGGEVFQGEEGKTKKQAEMKAAKIAFNALTERKAAQSLPSGNHMTGASEVTSPTMEPAIYNSLQQEFANAQLGNKEAAHSKDASPSSSEVKGYLQDPVPDHNDAAAPSEVKGYLQDPLPDHNDAAAPSALELKSPKDNNSDLLVPSDNAKPAGVGHALSCRIVIHPRGSEVVIPDGASMLPCSDDKWVAHRMQMNQV